MKPKSANLFHFTKSLDVLKLILENGIQPRYCLEDFEWFNIKDKYLAFPMSCFCDIPLSRISDHTDFYGNYGIGLTRSWGIRNSLNPVIYCPANSHIQDVSNYLFDIKVNSESEEDEHSNQFYKLISLIKPIEGRMVIAGEVIEKEFYQENEWRFVPQIGKIIFYSDYEKDKTSENKKIEAHSLELAPQDIRYIFVKSDDDIPELVDFINSKLGKYPLNDLKILLSRIVSLKALEIDL